jgi:hypothetical protein
MPSAVNVTNAPSFEPVCPPRLCTVGTATANANEAEAAVVGLVSLLPLGVTVKV